MDPSMIHDKENRQSSVHGTIRLKCFTSPYTHPKALPVYLPSTWHKSALRFRMLEYPCIASTGANRRQDVCFNNRTNISHTNYLCFILTKLYSSWFLAFTTSVITVSSVKIMLPLSQMFTAVTPNTTASVYWRLEVGDKTSPLYSSAHMLPVWVTVSKYISNYKLS